MGRSVHKVSDDDNDDNYDDDDNDVHKVRCLSRMIHSILPCAMVDVTMIISQVNILVATLTTLAMTNVFRCWKPALFVTE